MNNSNKKPMPLWMMLRNCRLKEKGLRDTLQVASKVAPVATPEAALRAVSQAARKPWVLQESASAVVLVDRQFRSDDKIQFSQQQKEKIHWPVCTEDLTEEFKKFKFSYEQYAELLYIMLDVDTMWLPLKHLLSRVKLLRLFTNVPWHDLHECMHNISNSSDTFLQQFCSDDEIQFLRQQKEKYYLPGCTADIKECTKKLENSISD